MTTDPGHLFDRPRIMLAEADPRAFLGSFFQWSLQEVNLVLVDPALPSNPRMELVARLMPSAVIDGHRRQPDGSSLPWHPPEDWASRPKPARIWIGTGGTTGSPRFALHSWQRLSAAANGFGQVFPGSADCVCLLPLWHVGGLMQVIRATVLGGEVELTDWRTIKAGESLPDSDGKLVSMVPQQLDWLLEGEGSGRVSRSASQNTRHGTFLPWLRGFRAIFVGGGGARASLLNRARELGLRLAPAYGMTETAAQVTVLRPDEFLEGRGGVGRALPHATVTIVNDAGQPAPAGEIGRIRIATASRFLGYADTSAQKGSGFVVCSEMDPLQTTKPDPFISSDLGRMDGEGYLTVVGRVDDVIITGGEKVFPGEVEAVLMDSGLAGDAVVFGTPDAQWGQVVSAVIEGGSFVDGDAARAILRERLPVFKIPRRWVRVSRLPRNAMGKLDRKRLEGLFGVQ
ncbi:MAG: AMP-binding protein [Opitutaceae bacterium]